MRTLAIDLGTRRVGLALSDEGGRFATPLDVLQVAGHGQATEPILRVIAKEGVTRLVVGLPLNMDNTLGPAARATIEWADDLTRRSGLAVVYVDERLSSFAAEESIVDRKRGGEKITRRQKKQRLDAIAAAGFLQGFLDGVLSPLEIRR